MLPFVFATSIPVPIVKLNLVGDVAKHFKVSKGVASKVIAHFKCIVIVPFLVL